MSAIISSKLKATASRPSCNSAGLGGFFSFSFIYFITDNIPISGMKLNLKNEK